MELSFAGRRVTVLGLGHFGGGVAVARWLCQQGASVLVTDQSPAQKLADSMQQLADLPIEFRLGPEQRESDFTQADLVVASPAVPLTHPYLKAAQSAGVPVTTEICLFVQRCPARVIGVTGTKGKSTTSTLLHRMLSAHRTTWFGGNIGKSLLPDLDKIEPDQLVVLELSSFMLEHLRAIEWSPAVAVVTMISADHLDWHGSEAAYIDAKCTIVKFQKKDDLAILNSDNAIARSFAESTPARAVFYHANSHPRFALKLAGEHNQLNAQAAFTTAQLLSVDWQTAQDAIADFTGLPHRLQLAHEHNGVQYVNDSISTIPEAAIAALNAFPAGRVIQIVGGSSKNLPVDELCHALQARAKAVLCIGKTAGLIASHLPGHLARRCGDLQTAMVEAKQLAVPGDVVLLSPGHPSYDQFTNFQERGELFSELARRNG